MKKHCNAFIKLFFWIYSLFIGSNLVTAIELPKGFVYLKEIEPSIIENLRYYSNENFIGRKIDGYEANRVILTLEAAKALASVQRELLKDGYSLVIYDAYRPQRAVDLFVRWSSDISDQAQKDKYYPDINKEDVLKLKYIAEKSSHTRGSTVDISMIKLGNSIKSLTIEKRQLRNGDIVPYLDDGTIDMGTSFDLFDPSSHHDSDIIDANCLKLRNYLRALMKKNGFAEHQEEWWHYTLKDEPFPNSYFDFIVK